MKAITNKYSTARQWLFKKRSWKKFYTFASLPELKFMKTIGFIASWIL